MEDLLYPSHHGNTLYVLFHSAFPGDSVVKNPPAKQETQVQSLDQEDLENKMATTPVYLYGKSHGQRSLAGYSPQGLKKLDMT